MPDASGQPQPGEPGYTAPAPVDPTKSIPGLINTTPGKATVTPGDAAVGYTPATATATPVTATGYDPNAFAVTSDQTVQGQLKGIINDDSPLMQQSKTRAMQEQNARGTLNSSMAVGAGQQAVIASALPIAQQDATTNFNANMKTVDAQNAALNFGAAAKNTASQANAQLGTNVDLANQQAVNAAFTTSVNNITQLTNTKLNNASQLALQSLDAQSKMALSTLDAQNRQLLQTNQGASNAYVQAVTNISNIALSKDMGEQAKKDATASQIALLNEQLKTMAGIASTQAAAVTALDLSKYFNDGNFQPVAGAQGAAGASGTVTYTGANGLQYATQAQADQSMAGY